MRGDKRSVAALEAELTAIAAAGGERQAAVLPILNALARNHLNAGRIKEARRCAERALKVAETQCGEDSAHLARPLALLAEVYFALGLMDRCHQVAERALAILVARLGDAHPETAKARVRLGVALTEMGVPERAIALHRQALVVMRAQGRKDWAAAILASLGAASLAAGESTAAVPLYEEALATARAAFGDSHATTAAYMAALADCLVVIGEDERAPAFYRQTHAVLRAALGEMHPDAARARLSLALLERKKHPAQTPASLFQALAVLAVHGRRPRALTEAYPHLARMLPDSAAAILFWKLAVIDIERIHRHVARLDGKLERAFVKKNADEFRELGDALIRRGRLPEAQQVLAIIKERELFGLTGIEARRTKISLTPLEIEWTRRGAKLVAELSALLNEDDAPAGMDPARTDEKIEQAGRRVRAWFEQLVAAFAAAEAGPSTETHAADVAPASGWRVAEPGTALLQYLFAPDRLSVSIVLTIAYVPRERRVALPEGELNRLVFGLRDAVQARSADFLAFAQRLYQILIAPVANDLQANGIETLAFWLDDVLRYVPMGALHDGERFLIERFDLVLAAGTSVAGKQVGVARAAGLGVSRPVAGCRPLLAVREELAAVVREGEKSGGVLPGTVRIDEAFTAEAMRQAVRENSVVHIASHFVFAAARETSSYLVLGDGSKLTLAQLGGLRFDAVDLVALSACNTAVGAGHRQNGREIEGLGALVHEHGARKVLATLWPVADVTTAALMRQFYRLTYEAGLRPARALRRAQLALLGDAGSLPRAGPTRSLIDPDDEPAGHAAYPGTSHPFYWAPYILMEGSAA
jgi:CHAT domain-containing protein/tetratricopeptide (TPR) repeat protein